MSDDILNTDDGSCCLAKSRSKRQRLDRNGRFAALERLKSLKGSKNKYELKEETPVYEEVEESVYSRLVQQRQDDDWIVDDDGCGYVEDGREIFDDNLEDNNEVIKTKKESRKYKPPPTKKSLSTNKPKDIKSMFMAQPIKRKSEQNAKLDDDDLLGDIIQQVHSKEKLPDVFKPTVLKRKIELSNNKILNGPYNPFALKKIQNNIGIKEIQKSVKNSTLLENGKCNQIEMPTKQCKQIKSPVTTNFINITNHDDIKCKEVESIEEMTENFEDFEDISKIEEFNSYDENAFIKEEYDDKMHIEETDFNREMETDHNNKTVSDDIPEITNSKETQWFGLASIEPTSVPEVFVDSSHLPLTLNENNEKIMKFFWIDAYEDYFKHPGKVYLFGKVWYEEGKSFVSCCVIVKNIQRKIFLLPRFEPDDNNSEIDNKHLKAIYMEFNDLITEKYKITEFKSKVTSKYYAFEKKNVPYNSKYLEVRYSAEFPPLPSDLNGKTFSHVFGTNTSSLEQLLLDCKLKGPSWLEIKCPIPSDPPVSWCKFEVSVSMPEDIMLSKSKDCIPPFVVLSLSLQTVVHPNTQQNEIVAASCFSHSKFPLDKVIPNTPYQSHFCVFTKPSNCVFPFDFKNVIAEYKHTKVEIVDSERSLLGLLLAKIYKIDPDVIVGHDILGYDIEVLLHRITVNKVPLWSRLGRLKRTGMPHQWIKQKTVFGEKNVICGRLFCDVKLSAKELIRCRSYDLTELSKYVLKENILELSSDDIFKKYSSSRELLQLIDCTMKNCVCALKIMCDLNVLPLALQITNIAGNLMSRTLLGGRSERNEFLLLHAFYEKNFICPDKNFNKKNNKFNQDENINVDDDNIKSNKSTRKKPAYTGGLVLEPKKGFYDKFILLVDFNSLYPSIIQEYNICFTTVKHHTFNDENDLDKIELPEKNLEPGILPTEIRKLVESRRQVKQLMKNTDTKCESYLQYDIRQKALKLTANSMYGCLGFSNSRFYAKPLAALITSKGREILLHTKDLVEKMNFEVIYGDTDSLMINSNSTNYEEVLKIGNKIKTEVNKLYHQLEIDIDGIFKSMLLLKKKKYAALTVSISKDKMIFDKELKGLDIVRRDWSELAKKTGQTVIDEILSDKPREDIVENIHSHLMKLQTLIKEGKVPLSQFIITKQLTKNPENYPDKKNLSHVQVALNLNSKGGKKLKQGDVVPYIICEDGSNRPATQRCYHPDELKNNENIKIDVHYYLAHQIHPVVSRLCNPIEGTDDAAIANFLGLDPSAYKRSVQRHDEDNYDIAGTFTQTAEDRFKNCDKLSFLCPNEECCKAFQIENDLILDALKLKFEFPKCPNCEISLNQYVNALRNQLNRIMRQYIFKYYQKWLICEDPICGYRTKKLPLHFNKYNPLCQACKKGCLNKEYSDHQLYNQLAYFQQLFDIDQNKQSLSKHEQDMFDSSKNLKECEKFFNSLKCETEKLLRENAYNVFDLQKLFGVYYPLQA